MIKYTDQEHSVWGKGLFSAPITRLESMIVGKSRQPGISHIHRQMQREMTACTLTTQLTFSTDIVQDPNLRNGATHSKLGLTDSRWSHTHVPTDQPDVEDASLSLSSQMILDLSSWQLKTNCSSHSMNSSRGVSWHSVLPLVPSTWSRAQWPHWPCAEWMVCDDWKHLVNSRALHKCQPLKTVIFRVSVSQSLWPQFSNFCVWRRQREYPQLLLVRTYTCESGSLAKGLELSVMTSFLNDRYSSLPVRLSESV